MYILKVPLTQQKKFQLVKKWDGEEILENGDIDKLINQLEMIK